MDTVLDVNDKGGHEVKPGSLGISEVRAEDAMNGINHSGVVNVHNDQRVGVGLGQDGRGMDVGGGMEGQGVGPIRGEKGRVDGVERHGGCSLGGGRVCGQGGRDLNAIEDNE